MKKILLFLMFALFCIPWAANAQTTVEIGSLDGAGNNSYLPMNSLYNYSYTQQIYTADEIGMGGTINSITIWMYGNANLYAMPFTIYMVETDKDAFASTTDWESVTASDIVYTGTVTVHNTTEEAYTFTLATPFVYSGQGNLLIAFNNTTGQWKSGLNGKVFGASDDPVRAIYARQDGSAYDPYNPTFTATGTTYQRNVIEMDITTGSATCERPDLELPNVSAYECNIGIVGGSGVFNVEYKASSDTAWTVFATAEELSMIVLEGLTPATNYQVGLQSV